jgi:membrane-associated phospholipid phosphatase
VWSRQISYGYWFATANCLNWALGTISYYLIPTMGPTFWYPWLYRDLDVTAVTELQDSLWNSRQDVRFALNPFSDSIQSVAGFASLHVSLTLIIAMIAQYTVRHRLIKVAAWVFFVLTVISTLYFGWHYIADDVGGVVIAVLAVWLGAIATGHTFERHGRSIRSTTAGADVPLEGDLLPADEQSRP